MTDLPLRVVETPAEALRRLALTPDAPREDLWEAIARAVIDVNERLAVLEAQVNATNEKLTAAGVVLPPRADDAGHP